MKNTFGYAAIVFALIGMGAGITDWALTNYVLEALNWEGPLVSIQLMCWFLSYIGFGAGIILSALAGMAKSA